MSMPTWNEVREARLADLEREADRLGCAVIPAVPVPPPSKE